MKAGSAIGAALLLCSCSSRPSIESNGDSVVTRPQWLVAIDGEPGEIDSTLTRSFLAQRFGSENLHDEEIQIGEGETKPGTVVYPNDSTRRFASVWNDPKRGSGVDWIRLDGSTSTWEIRPGFSLGTTLRELEKLNGGPFTLTGFNWDYAGTVVSWRGGRLEKLSGGSPHIYVRLAPSYDGDPPTQKDGSAVMGDHEFSSEIGPMQRLDPRVYQILVVFRQEGAK